MMRSGKAAIDYLVTEIDKADVGSSSFWDELHLSFQFTSKGPKGLIGLGGHSNTRGAILRIADKFLQYRFREMGGCNFSAIDVLAAEMVLKQNRSYDVDVLRQVLTISFLKSTVPQVLSSESTGCVIGDGFASMTSLLLKSQSAARVVLINLNKALLVDLWYLRLWMGDEIFASSVDLVTNKDELACALAKTNIGGQVIAIQAMNHELLRDCPINFVVNIASMGEMNPDVITAYFEDLRAIKSWPSIVLLLL
ncbi:MAG TPA: putative sugar O-methyltransferase [Rhodospirillales bacterium]|nr:putative sugar O-methyltransferase [Rhodospirillales bacterium]